MLANLSETTVSLVEDVSSIAQPHTEINRLFQSHSKALSEIHTPIEIFKYVANEQNIDTKLFHALQFCFVLSIDHLQANLGSEFQDQRNLMLTNALYKAITQLIEQPQTPSRSVLFLVLNLSAFSITLPTSILNSLHERCDHGIPSNEAVQILPQDNLGFMFQRLADDEDIDDAFLVYQALSEPLLFFSESIITGFIEQLFEHPNAKLHDSALFFMLDENENIAQAAFNLFQQEALLEHATIQDLARLQVIRQWFSEAEQRQVDAIIRKVQRRQTHGDASRGGLQLVEAKATLADYSESFLVKLSFSSTNDSPVPSKTLHAYCHFALCSGIENIQFLHNEADLVNYEQMMQESELEFKVISEAQLQQLIEHTLSQQSLQNPPAELLCLWQWYDVDCFYPQPADIEQLLRAPIDNPGHFTRDELIEQWILLDMDYDSEYTPNNAELLHQHLIHALILYQGQTEMIRELTEVASTFARQDDFFITSIGASCHAQMMEAAADLPSLPDDFADFGLFEATEQLSELNEEANESHNTRPKNYWLLIESEPDSDTPIVTLKINDAITLTRFHTVLAIINDWQISASHLFENDRDVFTDSASTPLLTRNMNKQLNEREVKDAQLRDLFQQIGAINRYVNNINAPQSVTLSVIKTAQLQDLHLFPVIESYLTPMGAEDHTKRQQLQYKLDALFRGQLH